MDSSLGYTDLLCSAASHHVEGLCFVHLSFNAVTAIVCLSLHLAVSELHFCLSLATFGLRSEVDNFLADDFDVACVEVSIRIVPA